MPASTKEGVRTSKPLLCLSLTARPSTLPWTKDTTRKNPEYAGPIDDYFKGVNDAFAQAAGPGNQPKYAIGVYGPGAVCAWLKGKGRVASTWLAKAKLWPGFSYSDWDVKQGFRDPALPFGHDIDECKPSGGLWQIPNAAANVA
jgi:hypothetical protein